MGAWSAGALRDLVEDSGSEALGEPAGVLVVDETRFLKKGTHSVGIGRRYSGMAGRIETRQEGAFVSYASWLAHTLTDCRLYPPKDWAADEARCIKANGPEDIAFPTNGDP
ncbi:MAG: transposase [Rhodospirillum sp.]|nr:transposase [Rhodospirillum sp.]MCF8489109.1 transposase [Rhodospirillum sp.]MCF8498899.1 transposase [Rhodospirillum sp.]